LSVEVIKPQTENLWWV